MRALAEFDLASHVTPRHVPSSSCEVATRSRSRSLSRSVCATTCGWKPVATGPPAPRAAARDRMVVGIGAHQIERTVPSEVPDGQVDR